MNNFKKVLENLGIDTFNMSIDTSDVKMHCTWMESWGTLIDTLNASKGTFCKKTLLLLQKTHLIASKDTFNT